MQSFPGSASGQESACGHNRLRFDPWVGKIPWRRKWQPTPVFSPEESCGQRSLAVYRPWGRKESDTTGQLNKNNIQLLGFPDGSDGKESACNAGLDLWVWSLGWKDSPGEGNGYPFQYSCLGNPMDRGAWWGTIPGVRRNQTWLSGYPTPFHFSVVFCDGQSMKLAWRLRNLLFPSSGRVGVFIIGLTWTLLQY